MKTIPNCTNQDLPKVIREIRLKDISHLQASSNYTILRLRNGDTVVSGYSLKVFDDLFDDGQFLRIDRSNLVNKNFINRVIKRKKIRVVQLMNQLEIPISRRRWSSMNSLVEIGQ